MNRALRQMVATLEPGAVPLFETPDVWAEFDEMERLAAAAKLILAPRVEESCTWRTEGYRSAAEQMAAKSGTSVAAAQSLLETSQRVAELPKTEAVLRTGALSPAKARVVSAAAMVAPDREDALLELAEAAPYGKVRKASLEAKASVGIDETHARITRERSLREYTDDEGAWVLHARGPAEAGLAFRAAIDPIIDRYFKIKREPEDREPREAYAFDALIEAVTRSADGEAKKSSGRYLGLIRADLEAMQRGKVEGDEVCEIAGLGPVPVDVAKKLLGEAVLKLVLTKGVDVANVTHLGRAPTVAQKSALLWMSPDCTALDCSRAQRLEYDHREEWHKTHHTRIDETDRLCEHCHDLKTYFGWALVEGTGKRPLVPPDDPRHPKNKPKP
jgi:hypothetical protein